MSLLSRTFYVPASTAEAYQEWKAVLRLSDTQGADEQDCALIKDVPHTELRWHARWWIALIDGRADFIPAQGGCVVRMNIRTIGAVSRLIFSVASRLARSPWRHVNAFGQLSRRYG